MYEAKANTKETVAEVFYQERSAHSPEKYRTHPYAWRISHMKIKTFTKYDRPTAKATPCGGVSMTDPQYVDECNPSKILAKYGCIPPNKVRNGGQYIDCTQFTDFGNAFDIVTKGLEEFNRLPSAVRARFGNSPEAFFEFATDGKNAAEMVRLGLATMRETPKEEKNKESVTAPGGEPGTAPAK